MVHPLKKGRDSSGFARDIIPKMVGVQHHFKRVERNEGLLNPICTGDLISAIPEHAEWKEWLMLYQIIVMKQGSVGRFIGILGCCVFIQVSSTQAPLCFFLMFFFGDCTPQFCRDYMKPT